LAENQTIAFCVTFSLLSATHVRVKVPSNCRRPTLLLSCGFSALLSRCWHGTVTQVEQSLGWFPKRHTKMRWWVRLSVLQSRGSSYIRFFRHRSHRSSHRHQSKARSDAAQFPVRVPACKMSSCCEHLLTTRSRTYH